MRHYSKLLYLLVLCVLYTQTFSHKADPNPKLTKYTLFATDSIIFGDQGYGQSTSDNNKIDSCVLPGPGFIGTNGVFDMSVLPTQSVVNKINADVIVGGSSQTPEIILPQFGFAPPNYMQLADTNSIILDPAGSIKYGTGTNKALADKIIRSAVDAPITNSADWYNIFKASDFPAHNATQTSNTITPGSYDKIVVQSGSELIFDCGTDNAEFYITNLDLSRKTQIKIVKEKEKFCRIFIKNDVLYFGENFKLSPVLDDDRRKVLLYLAGKDISTARISYTNMAPVINASIVAPRAHIKLDNFVNIGGQILGRTIEFVGAFNADGFDFEPWTDANVTIDPPKSIDEDPHMDPDGTTNNTSQITVTLSEEIPSGNGEDDKPNQAIINYEFIDATQKWGTDFFSTSNAVSNKKGSLIFIAGDTKKTIPLTIIDETVHDPNQHFIVKFSKGTENIKNYTINFASGDTLSHKIEINNDDPANTKPKKITLNPTEVKEEQVKGTIVGDILVTDSENNVTKVEVVNSATTPFIVKTNISATDTTYQLITDDVFDFEQGPRSHSVDIKATDKGNESLTTNFTINILPINDSTCKADTAKFDVRELDSLIGKDLKPFLTDGDSVADDNVFVYTPAKAPSNGHLRFELKADGTFDYVPDPSLEITIDSFSYTVKDYATYDPTENISDTAWVFINILPENDNDPVADTFAVELYEGEAVTIKDLFTDADSLNDSHTIKAWGKSTAEESITVHAVDSIVYLTSQNPATEIFWDSVFYEVKDEIGHLDTGLIVLNIKPLNDNIPVAAMDSVEVTIGRSTTVDVMLLNDDDGDKPVDQHTIQLTNSPIKSGPTLDGGAVTVVGDKRRITLFYDPNKVTKDTVDFIEYEIEDPTTYDPNNTINTATGILKVFVILPDSTKPIANDDFIFLKENDTTNLLVSGKSSVMDNDAVSSTKAGLDSVALGRGPDHGTIILNRDGSFTYDHDDTKEFFFDSFTYILVDSAQKTSLPATVHITIDTLNDNPPTIVGEEVACDENGTVSVNVIANDDDLDIFTHFVVTPAASQPGLTDGTITLVDSILTYTNNGTEGKIADTVYLEIKDSTTYDPGSIRTLINRVIITITPQNDEPPVGSDKAYTLKEGETLAITDSLIGLLSDATDADLIVGDTLSARLVTPPSYGGTDFDINSNGTFTYIHDDSENFFDSLVFEISDGIQKVNHTARFTITPVNDNKPVAVNDTFPAIEGATITPIESVLQNDSDVDMYLNGTEKVPGILTTSLLLVTEPYHGTATLTTDGFVTYTHDGSESTIDSMQYLVTDFNGGINRFDTATIFFTIPQSAPTIDSSFYFDDNGDGQIERVEVYFNDSLFLSETSLGFQWEDGTDLVITEMKQSSNGQEVTISVSGSPLLTTSGKLSLTVTHSNKFSSESETVTVADRAAPIISHAVYYHNKTEGSSDSITVHFSETIGSFTGAPYLYLDKITLGNYTISHTFQSITEKSITYIVTDKSVKYVHNDDSIRVVTPNIVTDDLGNLQDSTIWAPVTFVGSYDFNVELFIVPQPMRFEKVGSRAVAKEIDVNLLEYYSFPQTAEKRGVAFILTASLPLGAPELQEGYYTIYDAVGNMIAPRRPMSFARDEQNRLNGLATWSGNNLKDRTVGKSAYFCLVEVALTTDGGQKMEPITIKRPIGVAE